MKGQLTKRVKRKRAVRNKIKVSLERPRLMVFRSNSHIYASLMSSSANKTLTTVSDLNLETAKSATKTQKAFEVGKNIAKEAKKHKVSKVVFDRSGYYYHGRVKSVADGAREGGLEF